MEVYFKNLQKIIIENIIDAEDSIYIAVAWFTDKKIINALMERLKEGVEIKVLIFKDSINQKEKFYDLYLNGAELKWRLKLMHHKFCIIDKRILLSGSYNYTYSAKNNDENIHITKSPEIVKKYLNEFEDLFFEKKSVLIPFKSPEEVIESEKNKLDDFVIRNNLLKSYPYFHWCNINYYVYKNVKAIILIRNLEDIIYLKSCFEKVYIEYPKELTYSSLSQSFPEEQKNFLISEKPILAFKHEGVNARGVDLITKDGLQKSINFVHQFDRFFYNGKTIYNENLELVGELIAKPVAFDNDYVLTKEPYRDFVSKYGVSKITGKTIVEPIYKSSDFKVNEGFIYKILEVEKEHNMRKNSPPASNQESSQDSHCYIATLVYQSPNHPKVIFLKYYRDSHLKNNSLGQQFIKFYYLFSPKLVKVLKPFEIFQIFIRKILNIIISILKNRTKPNSF